MRRSVGLLGLAALLAGACSTSVNVEQERSALLQRDRDWSQTTTDVDKFMAFLAPGAGIYPTGTPVVTGDGIRTMFAQMSKTPGFSLTWTPATAEVSAAGDLGYTTGTYTSSSEMEKETGKYVTTWRKIGNEWKVTADIFNANGPTIPQHTMVAPATVKWGDPPPGLPAGAKFAVVSGDPSQPMPFVVRAQMPAGYKIPPHWHPTTENLTVISGTVAIGMGDTFDQAAMKDLGAGGYAVLPTEMRHSFMSKTAATIQIHGTGPFAITYVTSTDDPRQQTK
jgi:ketosteroid isomerase-like protein